MEAAIRVQSTYQKRIEAGIDTGDQPEAAGMMAGERMFHAHSTYVYKSELDGALVNEQYELLTHKVIPFTAQPPAVAASVFFDLDTRPNDEEAPKVALNIFPTSKDEAIAVFSYMEQRGGRRIHSRCLGIGGVVSKISPLSNVADARRELCDRSIVVRHVVT